MRNLALENWMKQMKHSAKEKKVPINAHFELTARCNLDCKMCYIHNQNSNSLKDKELSTDQWKKIFDDAYDCGMLFADLSGGECLLRHDFKELYLHLWMKRVYITVMTNGILINDEILEFFKKYPPAFVQISLYGSCDEGYLKVTGHRGYDKAIAAINNLTALKIPVRVVVTPSKYMLDDFINIKRICKENEYWNRLSIFHLADKRDESENDDCVLTVDEIVELSKQEAMLKRSITPLDFEPPFCGGDCTQPPKGLTCSGGSSTLAISYDGKMQPCAMLPIGKFSVLEMSYAEAWEKTKEAVQEILLGAECVGCPYDKLCPKCPSMRLTGLYTGHCNPDVCEVTKRLVAAGVRKLPASE